MASPDLVSLLTPHIFPLGSNHYLYIWITYKYPVSFKALSSASRLYSRVIDPTVY